MVRRGGSNTRRGRRSGHEGTQLIALREQLNSLRENNRNLAKALAEKSREIRELRDLENDYSILRSKCKISALLYEESMKRMEQHISNSALQFHSFVESLSTVMGAVQKERSKNFSFLDTLDSGDPLIIDNDETRVNPTMARDLFCLRRVSVALDQLAAMQKTNEERHEEPPYVGPSASPSTVSVAPNLETVEEMSPRIMGEVEEPCHNNEHYDESPEHDQTELNSFENETYHWSMDEDYDKFEADDESIVRKGQSQLKYSNLSFVKLMASENDDESINVPLDLEVVPRNLRLNDGGDSNCPTTLNREKSASSDSACLSDLEKSSSSSGYNLSSKRPSDKELDMQQPLYRRNEMQSNTSPLPNCRKTSSSPAESGDNGDSLERFWFPSDIQSSPSDSIPSSLPGHYRSDERKMYGGEAPFDNVLKGSSKGPERNRNWTRDSSKRLLRDTPDNCIGNSTIPVGCGAEDPLEGPSWLTLNANIDKRNMKERKSGNICKLYESSDDTDLTMHQKKKRRNTDKKRTKRMKSTPSNAECN